MRVAALHDVHGNVRALEAVLADTGDVDAIVLPQLEHSDWSAFTAAVTIVNPGSVELRTTEYGSAATADAMRRSSMPPTVEQLLERLA